MSLIFPISSIIDVSQVLIATLSVVDNTIYGTAECPSIADISPCKCGEYGNEGNIYLDCNDQKLDDTQISDILDAFLPSNNAISNSLAHLDLTSNRLTSVPSQVRLFNRLEVARFDSNNIRTIGSDSFNLSSIDFSISIYFMDNQLISVEPNAFQGLHTRSYCI